MEIKELKSEKLKLEYDIEELILKFMEKFEVGIIDFSFDSGYKHFGERRCKIKIEISL